MFADSHTHSLMKYVQNERTDIWQSFKGKWVTLKIRDDLVGIPTYSQSDFSKMVQGGVQIVFCALIPPEQKFMFNKFPPEFDGAVDKIAATVTSIPISKVREYQKPTYNHYEHLLVERDLLYSHHDKPVSLKINKKKKSVRLVITNTFSEVEQVLQRNATNHTQWTIAVIPTVEGVHALGRGHLHLYSALNPNNVSEPLLLERLDKLKGLGQDTDFAKVWPFPPLIMNLTHAFDNGICGQPQAFSKVMRSIFEYDEPYQPNDQGPNFTRGLNKPLTPFGEQIIKRMLNLDAESLARTNPGRRIIPDIKHMSVQTRHAYYQLLDGANAGKPEDERIPIVMSHAAVNGKAVLPNGPSTDEQPFPSDTDDEYAESTTFNPWSINLYDDEIVRIHETRGLIGIIMDERVLAGGKKVKQFHAYLDSRAGLRNPFRGYKQAEASMKMIADQIEHIVRAVQRSSTLVAKSKAWDCICIGSDFDGQINPIDAFTESSDFPKFRKALGTLLREEQFAGLYQGYSAEEIVDKICLSNVVEFLRRNLK